MIYLIGGAPRAGKSILCQRMAARLGIGWVSTDLLFQLLRVKPVEGMKSAWDADPGAVAANAEWFFPYLERFIRGADYLADHYAIEGVDFLPAQAAQLANQYPLRVVFLGRSSLTLEDLDRFPGRSRGYGGLPEAMRRRIAGDVPLWSAFVRRECERFGYPYVDTSGNFQQKLRAAEDALVAGVEADESSERIL